MSLDRKSLIQVVALVVLVVVGAGAYLMQQEGGLGFITDFFAENNMETTKATIRPPTGDKMSSDQSPASRVDKKAAGEVPTIPALPAKGQIRGKSFLVKSAVIENGVLTLSLGKDITADIELKVLLFTPRWEVPAGKNFKTINASGPAVPHIVIARKEMGENAPVEQKFTDKYTLLLEFGQEKDKRLPGKIYLSLPDEAKNNIAGIFEADIKGFRFVDGKPDLSSDSVDTLEYLALTELLRNDPDKPMEVVAFRDEHYTAPSAPGEKMHGYLEVEYRLSQGPSMYRRYQFVKEAGSWKLARALGAGQIDEAHPLETPGPKAKPESILTYLTAKKIEAEIQKKFPKKKIYGARFSAQHSDKYKLGVGEVSYRLEPEGAPQTAAYLFRRKPNAWTIERELSNKEKVNFDSGRIEKR